MIVGEVQRWLHPELTIYKTVYDSMSPVPYQSANDNLNLQFESRFECGNLWRATQIYQNEYDLLLAPGKRKALQTRTTRTHTHMLTHSRTHAPTHPHPHPCTHPHACTFLQARMHPRTHVCRYECALSHTMVLFRGDEHHTRYG